MNDEFKKIYDRAVELATVRITEFREATLGWDDWHPMFALSYISILETGDFIPRDFPHTTAMDGFMSIVSNDADIGKAAKHLVNACASNAGILTMGCFSPIGEDEEMGPLRVKLLIATLEHGNIYQPKRFVTEVNERVPLPHIDDLTAIRTRYATFLAELEAAKKFSAFKRRRDEMADLMAGRLGDEFSRTAPQTNDSVPDPLTFGAEEYVPPASTLLMTTPAPTRTIYPSTLLVGYVKVGDAWQGLVIRSSGIV